jgi:hypothetical protein
MRARIIAIVFFAALSIGAFAEDRTLDVSVAKGEAQQITVSIRSGVSTENRTNTSIDDAITVLRDAAGWGTVTTVTLRAPNIELAAYLPLLTAISQNPHLRLTAVIGQQVAEPKQRPEDIPYLEPSVERSPNNPLSEAALIAAAASDPRARHFLADLWRRGVLSPKLKEQIITRHLNFELVEEFPHDPKLHPTLRELKIIATTDFPFPESAWVEFSGSIAVGEQPLALPADSFDNSRSLDHCSGRYFASLGGAFPGAPIARGVIQLREVHIKDSRKETVWFVRRVTNEITLQERQ